MIFSIGLNFFQVIIATTPSLSELQRLKTLFFPSNLLFQQNPDWLELILTRFDYFMTALSTHIDLYKFTNEIDAQINTFSDKLQLTAVLNGKNVTVPNLPLWLNRNIDAKFDRPEQLAFSLGSAREFFPNTFSRQLVSN